MNQRKANNLVIGTLALIGGTVVVLIITMLLPVAFCITLAIGAVWFALSVTDSDTEEED